jgi:phosphoglycolate phosphatase
MKFKAVLFDLDGTLVDSLADLTTAVNHMLESLNKPLLTTHDVKNMVGKGARNLVQRAIGTSDPDEIRQGLEIFTEYNAAHIADASCLYPGIMELLEKLAAGKIFMAVISNKGELLSRLILKTLKIDHYFDVIAGGDTFPEMKPSPLPLVRVMELLGTSAVETVMVGDSINDIDAGIRAGIKTIGCDWGYGSETELVDATMRAGSCQELSELILMDGVQ